MTKHNPVAVEIAAKLEEDPALLGEVLVILGTLDKTRNRAVTVAAAESINVLRDAWAANEFGESLCMALDEWILE